MNPYDVLNVKKDATQKVIKKAYRMMAATHHPDKGGTVEFFHIIKKAYDVLSDPAKRKHYDDTGEIQEDKVNNLETEAYSLFVHHFNTVIQNLIKSGQTPEKHDLVDLMKQQIQLMIAKEIQPIIDGNNKNIEIYTKLKKRFKSKSKKAPFTEMLFNGVIASSKRNIDQIQPKLKAAERVLSLLDTIDFEKEEEVMRSFTINTGTATGSTYFGGGW